MVKLGSIIQEPRDLILEKEKGVNQKLIIKENLIIQIKIRYLNITKDIVLIGIILAHIVVIIYTAIVQCTLYRFSGFISLGR